MRARLIGALTAGAALITSAVLAAAPAAALPATWTVTPGGAFHGTAGLTELEIQESGIQLSCDSSSVDGTAQGGSGLSNPLATIPQSPGIQFNSCSGPFGLTFDVQQVGTWALNGVSYDGSNVTTGTIDNITADIVGPGCEATATGSVNATFANSTDVLTVRPDFTLVISSVDSSNSCFGLINEGEHANFSGQYHITPGLTVTSP